MFSFSHNPIEVNNITPGDKEDQTIGLEAFQGDSALIQTVNELNHLKHKISESQSI